MIHTSKSGVWIFRTISDLNFHILKSSSTILIQAKWTWTVGRKAKCISGSHLQNFSVHFTTTESSQRTRRNWPSLNCQFFCDYERERHTTILKRYLTRYILNTSMFLTLMKAFKSNLKTIWMKQKFLHKVENLFLHNLKTMVAIVNNRSELEELFKVHKMCIEKWFNPDITKFDRFYVVRKWSKTVSYLPFKKTVAEHADFFFQIEKEEVQWLKRSIKWKRKELKELHWTFIWRRFPYIKFMKDNNLSFEK